MTQPTAKEQATTLLTGLKGRWAAAKERYAPDPIKVARVAAKVQKAASVAAEVSKTVADFAAKPNTLSAGVAVASWAATKVGAEAAKHAKFKPKGDWRIVPSPWTLTGRGDLLDGRQVSESPGLYDVDGVRVWLTTDFVSPEIEVRNLERWREIYQEWCWNKFGPHIKNTGTGCSTDDWQKVMGSPQTDYVWSRLSPFVTRALPRSVLLDGRPGTGKSTMAKALAEISGPRSYRIELETATAFFKSWGKSALDILRPTTVIIDDLDRLGTAAVELLDGLERVRPPLLVVTTNNVAALDPAIVRPGRFDELFTIDSLGAAYFRDVLGLACWEALSPENQAKVEAWPAAFLNELRLRFEHLPACNVNAEFATLATRVSQNSRPTWATAAFTAVPTAT